MLHNYISIIRRINIIKLTNASQAHDSYLNGGNKLITSWRSIHYATKRNKWLDFHLDRNRCPNYGIRSAMLHNVTANVTSDVPPLVQTVPLSASAEKLPIEVDLTNIPEPPPIPLSEEGVSTSLNALGEPTLASLGLGGWSPVGIVQQCLEYAHVTLDIPWWGAIAIGTLIVRTLLFPLVIVAQRNAAKMSNYMPQLQEIQLKMTEARQTGNAVDSARYAQEMMIFMREKNVNPLKNLIVPIAQAPLFISFFLGLRGMSKAPVESMKEGGLLWFTDLTVADPTYILPIVTSATLYVTIQFGTDSAKLDAHNMGMMKYVLKALPLCIFPFTMHFPAAILIYWASSNFISLGQVALLKIPAVRQYFNIDEVIKHKPENLPIKKKKFLEGIKDSWQNLKITKEIEDRQRLDEIRFAKAGKGPLIKTYSYDPTKPRITPSKNYDSKKQM